MAKTLGGIGFILTLLGLVPFGAGTVLVVVGWILVLIAVKSVSDAVQDLAIFNNAIIGAGLAAVGAVGLYFVGVNIFSAIGGVASNPLGLIGSILQRLLLLWVVALVSSIFLYMSFKTIASRLNVGLLDAGAIVYVIGIALTIILVGFAVAFIGQVVLAIAFFSMPETTSSAASRSPPPSGQTTTTARSLETPAGVSAAAERRFCQRCGKPIDPGASFCPYCGASIGA